MSFRLYILQRLTAMLMLGLIPKTFRQALIFSLAVISGFQNALRSEILGRTRGSVAWAAFYGSFVLLAATHGAIGLRTVAAEWTGLRGRGLDALVIVAGVVLAALGVRAVYAVVGA